MKSNKLIVSVSLLLLLFLSIGMVAANENTTSADIPDSNNDLADTGDLEYNANMTIEQSVYINDYFDMNLKVNDVRGEIVADAKVLLDSSKNADLIDENSIYHFYISTNGTHNFTLDDGKYRASPIVIDVNPPVNLNPNNAHDETDVEDEGAQRLTLASENITMYYDDMAAEIVVWALDGNGNHIKGLNILLDGETKPDYDDKEGYRFLIDYLPVGINVFEVSLDDEEYKAEPILVEVNVLKSTPKVTAKKWYSAQNQYVTLKAVIEDKDQSGWIDEGTVTFKINGKSYTVNVDGGIAVKKIKIKKAGTYRYTATFKSSNHYTKKASSKVFVYSTSKKARTFNVKGYKIVVPVNKYKKLVSAKNTKKGVFYEINTNKFIKQTYRHYYSGNKYVYKTVKARGVICISFGGKNGLQTAPPNKYSLYLFTRYQFPDSFCTPRIGGQKLSTEINKLNKAKTISW